MAVPRVAGPLFQAIAATTAWLKQANVPAAVIGGVASLLGHPRVTKDVDLVALADDDDVPGREPMSLTNSEGTSCKHTSAFPSSPNIDIFGSWHGEAWGRSSWARARFFTG